MFLVQTTQNKFENGWTLYSEKASDVFRSHYTEKKIEKATIAEFGVAFDENSDRKIR